MWPEHTSRIERLRCALDIARRAPPSIIAGDALDTLPAALAEIPDNACTVVLHSFSANQLGEERRRIGNQELRFDSNEELASLTCFGRTVKVRGKIARSACPRWLISLFSSGDSSA